MARSARACLAFLIATLASVSSPAVRSEPSRPPGTAGSVKNEALRQELLRMANDDHVGAWRPGTDVRTENQERLKQIIAEHGWPGRSLVGEDGAQAAWLIAQHADRDLPFQKRCLELVRDAFQWKEMGAQELAYLTDRTLQGEGKPQMYGTQGVGATSPADEARIDANRKALGLQPWRVYVKDLQKRFPVSGSGPPPAKKAP